MKKIIIVMVGVIILFGGISLFKNFRQPDQKQEEVILESTLNISKEYASLRYRSDNVLINAKNFADYDEWNNEMSAIATDWEELEKSASDLEESTNKIIKEEIGFKFTKQALAYTKEEVTSIVDKAPRWKKISTLAKHLGVDAKMAQLILNETQNMISREAYGEEGDIFQKLENQAIIVKNTSKVTLFVGTIALTGGTAAIATGGTLGQAAVIVSGADLTLEITDDTAKMALGNKNKVSAIVGDVRKITEPAAAILMVSTLPNNLVKGIDKLNAVVFGADQLNGTIQSGSVIGIKLPTPTKENSEPATEVSILEKEEVNEWMKEQGVANNSETVAEIENILGVTAGIEAVKENNVEEGSSQKVEKTTQAENETAEEEARPKAARIGIAEYNELSDQGKFNTMKIVREYLGEPDFSTTNTAGRIVYIYLDRIEYEGDSHEGFRFTFYTLEDYQKIAESNFGWDEDYQEIWDASEGGLVAKSEVRATDSLKSEYGL